MKHVFLVNCGGNFNILEILEPEDDVIFYVVDRCVVFEINNFLY